MNTLRRSGHVVMTSDGVRISFYLYHQAGGGKVLIICPGFFQSKETAIFEKLSRDLAQDQDVLCMDFRGHGRSGGLYTFSAKEGADLEAVLRWVHARYIHVVLLGFSLGAATAINVASQQGGVDGLIAVSAPMAFEEIEFKFWTPEAIRTGLTGLESGAGFRPGNPWLKKARPSDAIRHLATIPVLLIHGTDDPIISHRHSQRLYEMASDPKHMEIIPGGGHAEELYRQNPAGFASMIQTWLNSGGFIQKEAFPR